MLQSSSGVIISHYGMKELNHRIHLGNHCTIFATPFPSPGHLHHRCNTSSRYRPFDTLPSHTARSPVDLKCGRSVSLSGNFILRFTGSQQGTANSLPLVRGSTPMVAIQPAFWAGHGPQRQTRSFRDRRPPSNGPHPTRLTQPPGREGPCIFFKNSAFQPARAPVAQACGLYFHSRELYQ